MSTRRSTRHIILALLALNLGGCALSQTERGAIVGSTGGAVVGALIGRSTGDPARGAIIGAAVGGAAGAIIGRSLEQQAQDLAGDLASQLPQDTQIEQFGDAVRLTFSSGVFFEFDSAAIRSDARASLDMLVTTLATYPGYVVHVVGHTDSRGSGEYNQRLSERRAQAAGDYLVTRGIPRNSVHTSGAGMNQPVASNSTDAGRAMNRRVELTVAPGENLRNDHSQHPR
jgi:outer membrane protein OmpA-like peptidoglycan-associated protein